MSGGGTILTGADLVNKVRRPPDNRAVQFLNGPGNNAENVRDGATHELKQGDVFVIPAGTGHEFTKIDDHITYMMIRGRSRQDRAVDGRRRVPDLLGGPPVAMRTIQGVRGTRSDVIGRGLHIVMSDVVRFFWSAQYRDG